jgi:hypothetical protein
MGTHTPLAETEAAAAVARTTNAAAAVAAVGEDEDEDDDDEIFFGKVTKEEVTQRVASIKAQAVIVKPVSEQLRTKQEESALAFKAAFERVAATIEAPLTPAACGRRTAGSGVDGEVVAASEPAPAPAPVQAPVGPGDSAVAAAPSTPITATTAIMAAAAPAATAAVGPDEDGEVFFGHMGMAEFKATVGCEAEVIKFGDGDGRAGTPMDRECQAAAHAAATTAPNESTAHTVVDEASLVPPVGVATTDTTNTTTASGIAAGAGAPAAAATAPVAARTYETAQNAAAAVAAPKPVVRSNLPQPKSRLRQPRSALPKYVSRLAHPRSKLSSFSSPMRRRAEVPVAVATKGVASPSAAPKQIQASPATPLADGAGPPPAAVSNSASASQVGLLIDFSSPAPPTKATTVADLAGLCTPKPALQEGNLIDLSTPAPFAPAGRPADIALAAVAPAAMTTTAGAIDTALVVESVLNITADGGKVGSGGGEQEQGAPPTESTCAEAAVPKIRSSLLKMLAGADKAKLAAKNAAATKKERRAALKSVNSTVAPKVAAAGASPSLKDIASLFIASADDVAALEAALGTSMSAGGFKPATLSAAAKPIHKVLPRSQHESQENDSAAYASPQAKATATTAVGVRLSTPPKAEGSVWSPVTKVASFESIQNQYF